MRYRVPIDPPYGHVDRVGYRLHLYRREQMFNIPLYLLRPSWEWARSEQQLFELYDDVLASLRNPGLFITRSLRP